MATTLLSRLQAFAHAHLDDDTKARLAALPRDNLNEFGVDPFGLDPDIISFAAPIATWLYKHYFRCETFGINNIPAGRVFVISNHSGQLPFDGFMIGTAFLFEAKHPRLLRGMAERWSADLPFISTLFARGGAVVGTPNTCKRLLEMDEAVLVFPEGVKGIIKLFKDRYKLLTFGHGFMRLALQTNTPILPVAVIGAEEQAPAIFNLERVAKIFGMPALPIVLPQIVPLPLPVKYRIHVGEPLHFKGDADDEDLVGKHVATVKGTMAEMIKKGLKERKGIFS